MRAQPVHNPYTAKTGFFGGVPFVTSPHAMLTLF